MLNVVRVESVEIAAADGVQLAGIEHERKDIDARWALVAQSIADGFILLDARVSLYEGRMR